jgi:hypothetical protein
LKEAQALMGISAVGVDIATAIVLILAVTVDSLVRREGATRTGARPAPGRDQHRGATSTGARPAPGRDQHLTVGRAVS